VQGVVHHYVLFPHLTGLDNVAFSPKMPGIGKATRRQQAYEMLALVQMEAFAERLASLPPRRCMS
jgi:putative spermidine/putrescine transport system ATP-binding protein